VASATWGERTDVWAGDHLNLVNWPNRIARAAVEWPTGRRITAPHITHARRNPDSDQTDRPNLDISVPSVLFVPSE